jgi:antitoxin YefM
MRNYCGCEKTYPMSPKGGNCQPGTENLPALDTSSVKAYVYPHGGIIMIIINATKARAKLYSLIDETADSHQPVIITGKRGNAVLVSEEDWNAISETLYLLSVPGMRESLKEGMEQDLSECSKELDW